MELDNIVLTFNEEEETFIVEIVEEEKKVKFVFTPLQFNDFITKSIHLMNTVMFSRFNKSMSDFLSPKRNKDKTFKKGEGKIIAEELNGWFKENRSSPPMAS